MNEITTVQNMPSERPLSALQIQQQVNTIQEVMQQVMVQDTHFGTIPGTNKPTLYKPGAEKIMATFRLSADPEITDLSTSDEIRYQVKVRLVSPSGVFVGSGIGECSTNEEKYKWRASVCDDEWEETAVDRRREKWKKGWKNNPPTKTKQVRTEPADLANTVLKMAKKRALVDAVLTATAASDIFTQDVEDLPEEYRDDAEPQMPEMQKPQSKQKGKPAKPDKNGPGLTDGMKKLLAGKLEASGKGMPDLLAHFNADSENDLKAAQINDLLKWLQA